MEDPSKMSTEELRERASKCSENFDNPNMSNMEKEHLATLAQVYLGELDRRLQKEDRRLQAAERASSARHAKRDFGMESLVILLISAELAFAYVGWREGKNQQEVFDELNKSSAETAKTLTAVREAQEASLETQKHTLEKLAAMNSALQDEMDLNITEALQYGGGSSGGGQERVDISNRGRTTLFLWGSKFDGQPPKMQQKATVLLPGNSATFDVFAVVKRFAPTSEGSTRTLVPFELYFTRENGTKYISKGTLQLNPNHSLWIDRMTSTRKQW
jgi:cell division protein FtsB